MKTLRLLSVLVICLSAASALAQVPQLLNYQGRVVVGTTNFDGSGQFKFALVNGAGSVTFWSNDGTSSGGSQPTASVSLPVTRGLYSVLLGDTTLAGMSSALPTLVFTNPDVRLRVWFNDGVTGFQQFAPDQRIAAVGYALMGANVPDGTITSQKLADGAVTASKLSSNSVTAAHLSSNAVTSLALSNHLALGHSTLNGSLSVFEAGATPAIQLLGAGNVIRINEGSTPHVELNGGATGSLRLYDLGGQNTAILDSGIVNGGTLRLQHSNSSPRVVLDADQNHGALLLATTNSALRVQLSNNTAFSTLRMYSTSSAPLTVMDVNTAGSTLSLSQPNGSLRARLQADTAGSLFTLYQADGSQSVTLDGDSSGYGLISTRATNAATVARITGGNGGEVQSAGTISVVSVIGGDVYSELGKNGTGGGVLRTYDELDNQTMIAGSPAGGGGGFINLHMNASIWPGVTLDGDDGNSGGITLKAANDSTRMVLDAFNGSGAEISMRHTNNVETVEIIASEGGTEGGQLLMRNESGFVSIQLDGDASGNGSGYLRLYKGDGSIGLTLEADAAGDSRVTTQVLTITGGADLSENFDIKSHHQPLQPGMIVCIDPRNPGQLVTSSKAYDKTVAGIVSGAGGVKPGMLMGQKGSAADGAHPVALTGRVYCMVDADQGRVEPGDLITTSDTPGHGMKVKNHQKSQGAIVGKAMTALEKGKGLVLVLVTLQ